jgi:preprotein translocase subunit SecE
MNRQAKRMMGKRQTAADRVQVSRRAMPPEKRKRVGPRQFLKEVRQELKKVAWPTRRELFAYTVVVLVAVVVLTSLVFGMDLLFSKAVLRVFGSGG